MNRMTRGWCWGVAAAMLAGCVPPPSFARLDGVLVDVQPDARPARPDELDRVEVTREGSTQPASEYMTLHHGDALRTAPDGVGILTLAAGYEVIMEPGTDVTIENPSIFVRIGKVIIKKVKEIAEKLTVNTEVGAAAVEGTQFVVEVTREHQVQVTVLEGRVKVYPVHLAAWRDTSFYVAGEQGAITAARITRMAPLSVEATTLLQRRIIGVERVVRPAGTRAGVITRPPDVTRVPDTSAVSPALRSRVDPRILAVRRNCIVPTLLRLTEAQARRLLTDGSWAVGDIRRGIGETITAQDPAAKASVACGAKVSFTIGTMLQRVRPPGSGDR
jgi:hypothetical protein